MSEGSSREPREYHYAEELEAMANIELAVAEWKAQEMSESSNIMLAHILSQYTLRRFPRLGFVGTELDIPPDELPPNIRTLLVHQHFGDMYYAGEPKIRITQSDRYIQAPERRDGKTFNEWADEYKTFERTAAAWFSPATAQTDPEEKMVDDTVAVSVEKGMDWGLEFLCRPNKIGFAIFGKREKTRRASEFALDNHSKQSELAYTVGQLCVLGARYALKARI